jgi:hypothetical protein
MLTTIELIKKDGGVLTLPIYDPTNFAVMDIQGLDPVKANIVTSNFSQMDGVQHEASRREMRNISFKFRILTSAGGVDVQELRKQLYAYLLPKSDIKMRFVINGGGTGSSSSSSTGVPESFLIDGQVESFDAPMFVKEPEATISILCFDPDFYSEIESTFSGTSVGTSVLDNYTIFYNGNIDTGFLFTMTANGPTNSFTIENTEASGSVKTMSFSDSTGLLQTGDIIKVSTIPGNKYVTRTRSGTETSILWALDRASDWIKLYPETNLVRVRTSTTTQMPFTMVWTDKIGGL